MKVEENEKRIAVLTDLLRRAWTFPEWPNPAEGEVSTSEDVAEQERWREQWTALDREIQAVLGGRFVMGMEYEVSPLRCEGCGKTARYELLRHGEFIGYYCRRCGNAEARRRAKQEAVS